MICSDIFFLSILRFYLTNLTFFWILSSHNSDIFLTIWSFYLKFLTLNLTILTCPHNVKHFPQIWRFYIKLLIFILTISSYRLKILTISTFLSYNSNFLNLEFLSHNSDIFLTISILNLYFRLFFQSSDIFLMILRIISKFWYFPHNFSFYLKMMKPHDSGFFLTILPFSSQFQVLKIQIFFSQFWISCSSQC